VTGIVERHLASDDRRFAIEPATPQTVAENHDVRPIPAIVGRLEAASNRRPDAQHVEERSADALTLEPLRLHSTEQGREPRFHHRERLERAAPCHQLAVGAEGDVQRRGVAADVRDCRDPARVRVGQRLEQDGIHRAEDRGRRADPERQRQHDGRGEAALHSEAPRGVPQIGEGGLEEVLPAVVADLLLDCRRTAEFQPCGAPCLVAREPPRQMRGRRPLEIVLHFVGGVLVRVSSMHERAQTARELAPPRHTASGWGRLVEDASLRLSSFLLLAEGFSSAC
jgi:hypothetical protein